METTYASGSMQRKGCGYGERRGVEKRDVDTIRLRALDFFRIVGGKCLLYRERFRVHSTE